MNAASAVGSSVADGLASPAAVLQLLIRTMRGMPVALPPGTPDRAAAEARLAGGVPALAGEELLASSDLLARAIVTARALAASPAGDLTLMVADWLERDRGRIDAESLTSAALAGTWEAVHALARRGRIDVDVACTVLDYAARPALRAGAAALAGLPALAPWGRGVCPACGAPPTVGVIIGKERERRLCCGRCGTGWTYPRVRCASCGERDHHRLGSLHAAGEGEYRKVDVCESCRGYLKTVAALDPPGPDRILELDLETAGLDFIALEQGYRRMGAEAW